MLLDQVCLILNVHGHTEIHLALPDKILQFPLNIVPQLQLHLRILFPELRKDLRKTAVKPEPARSEADAPFLLAGDIRQAVLQISAAPHHIFREHEHLLTRVGQHE